MLGFGRGAVQKQEAILAVQYILRFSALLFLLIVEIFRLLFIFFEETFKECGACDERVAFELVLDLVLCVDRTVSPEENVQVVMTYVIHEVFACCTLGCGFNVAEDLSGKDEPLIVFVPLLGVLHHG